MTRHWGLLFVAADLLIGLGTMCKAQAKARNVPAVEAGYLQSFDGTRLYYEKVGNGSETVIIPGRLFMFPHFQRLAKGRTLIAYDMRNRGQSDAVTDTAKIGLQQDADDLEAVRKQFHVRKANLTGFSYLGKMVILYATQHPEVVSRIVQLGPVARVFGTEFPKALTAGDEDKVPDPAEEKKFADLYKSGFASEHAKEFCEMEWKNEQLRMVGDPTHASRITSPCEMKNEWPIHLWPHFEVLLASDKAIDITKESVAKLTMPVLTIHGRKDRNAPYGGGREWDMLLPNARLITIEGAAHMSWIELSDIVFPNIELFLSGQWPDRAEEVKTLDLPSTRSVR